MKIGSEELLKITNMNFDGGKWLYFNEVLGLVLKMQEDFETEDIENSPSVAYEDGYQVAIKEFKSKTCEWVEDEREEGEKYYISKCGFDFIFTDDRGELTSYGFKFCPKCGAKIKEKQDV